MGGSVVNSGGDLVAGGSNGPRRQESSGGSFKLGGSSSSPSTSRSSVQEMLRRKWANSGSSSSTSAPAGDTKPLQSSKHTAVKAKSPADSSILNGSKVGSSYSKAEKQQCPICSKFFPAEEINPHLDLVCLLTKSDDYNDPDQVFDDDGSDADLIAAAQMIEEEDVKISSSKGSVLSISDSDDDEPLVKRVCDDKKQNAKKRKEEEVDLFGDTTLQDDLDLLAALEDVNKQEGDISMFACPVCNTLLNHAVMNQHLDVCIS